MRARPFAVSLVILLSAASLSAATFVVPGDRQFLLTADAAVVASPLSSYTRLTDSGSVQTVTVFSIEEVIKGTIDEHAIDVVEPGGVFQTRATIIPGVPRFEDGKRYLLFLMQGSGVWHVRDLALGKFSFAIDVNGRNLLVRDEEEIVGWDPDGSVHFEPHRAAALFLAYLRRAARGDLPLRDHPLPKDPVVPPNRLLPALSSDSAESARRSLRL